MGRICDNKKLHWEFNKLLAIILQWKLREGNVFEEKCDIIHKTSYNHLMKKIKRRMG
jgi:hypothetical protein